MVDGTNIDELNFAHDRPRHRRGTFLAKLRLLDGVNIPGAN